MAERPRRQGTGRKRLEMVKMKNESNRDVTFSKRHHGISRKLYELSTLTGANAAVIGFTTKNKPFAFGCPSVSYVLDKYRNPGENPFTFLRGLDYLDRDWGQEIVSLHEKLREKKKCGEIMNAIHKQRQKFWWEVPMEEFTFDQLEKHMIDLLKYRSYISNALKNRQVLSSVNFGSPLQGSVVQDAVSLPIVDFQGAVAVQNVVAPPTKNGFDLQGIDIIQGSIALPMKDFGFPLQGANALQTEEFQGAVTVQDVVASSAKDFRFPLQGANVVPGAVALPTQNFGFPPQVAVAGQGAILISSSVNGRNFTNGASSSTAAKYNVNNQINTILNPMQIQEFGFPRQGAVAGQGPVSSSVNGRNFTNGASSSAVAKYNANNQINTILNPTQIQDFGFPQQGTVAPPTENFGFPPVVIPSTLNEGNFTSAPSSSTLGEHNLNNQISTGLNPTEIQDFSFPPQGAVNLPTKDFGFSVEGVFANQGTIDVPSSVNQENFTTGAYSSAIAENNVPNYHNQISTDLNPMQIQSTTAATSFAGSSNINENVQPILDEKSFGDDLVYASLWPTREDELNFAKLMFG